MREDDDEDDEGICSGGCWIQNEVGGIEGEFFVAEFRQNAVFRLL